MTDRKRHISGPNGAGAVFWREATPFSGKPSTTEPSCGPAIFDFASGPGIEVGTCAGTLLERKENELGAYPVSRRWLRYRSADHRDGAPLMTEEAQHLRSIVQRLAALLALQPELDASCETTAADAFTADELGLRT